MISALLAIGAIVLAVLLALGLRRWCGRCRIMTRGRPALALLLMATVAGCADIEPGVGVVSGFAGIVANGQAIVHKRIDGRCARWNTAEGIWHLAQMMSKGALDAAAFKRRAAENNRLCDAPWHWPTDAEDAEVKANTDATYSDMDQGK